MTSPSPAAPPHIRNLRHDVEGLRAIAVGVVLLYHLHVPGVTGGFAGVDVFFVISGFLITSALLREVERSGTVSILDFYARRARRLLPAASVVILFTLVAGWFVLPTSARTDLLSDVFGSTLYVVNWVLSARSVDYLAEGASVSPLQHYWSLSVEEQFYVIWPLMILLALVLAARLRLRRRRTMLLLLSVLGIASLVWSILATRSDPATAYFVTTTRLWELAAGAVLAFGVPRLSKAPVWASQLAVLAGVVMIIVAVTLFDAATPWPGSAALLPVVGSVLVIAGGMPGHRTAVGALLSLPPMVWIGGLSYAIYLWHWPLIILAEARWGELSVQALVVLGAVSILLAWGTKHLVEDPIRFQRSLSARPWHSLALGGVTMAVICGLTGAAWVTRPTLQDADTPGPAALVADAAAATWEPVADPTTVYDDTGPLDPDPSLAREDVPIYYDDGCQMPPGTSVPDADCVYGDLESSTEVVLWGDSKLGQYLSAFDAIAHDEGWRLTTYLKSACPPTVDAASKRDCTAYGQHVTEQVLAQETLPELVLMSSGAGTKPALEEGMSSVIEQLADAGVPVVIVMDNSHPGQEAYECAGEHLDDLRACDFTAKTAQGAPLLSAVAQQTGVPVIDMQPWLCVDTDAACPVAIGGQLVYRQGSHVTDTYARALTPFLYRDLSALGLTTAKVDDIGLDEVPARVSE